MKDMRGVIAGLRSWHPAPIMLRELQITRIKSGEVRHENDVVVIETPLTIILNGEEVATLLSSPKEPELLATGFLLSEGIISSDCKPLSIRYNPLNGVVKISVPEGAVLLEGYSGGRIVGSGCAGIVPAYRAGDSLGFQAADSRLKIPPEKISALMKIFQKAAIVYRKSGGTHSCAVCSDQEMLFITEDIGRHNAMDRVAGWCFFNEVDPGDKLIFTSGRISSEIAYKAGKLGVPIIVSRSAPTSLAIDIAQKIGVTLVGFARGSRMNVYSEVQRIE